MINVLFIYFGVKDRIYLMYEQISLINYLSVIRYVLNGDELCFYLWFNVYVLLFLNIE